MKEHETAIVNTKNITIQYGFTVDDGPFLYATYGGEFEAKIKVSGDYKVRFDQVGMMIRKDHENYVKFGIEFAVLMLLKYTIASMIRNIQ